MATETFSVDENPLTTNWSTVIGQQALKADSGLCKSSSTYSCVAYWNSSSFNSDQYSQIYIHTRVGTSPNSGGVTVRCANTANTFYLYQYAASTYKQNVYKCVNGTYTKLGSDYADTLDAGSTMKLVVEGTTLTPYINGVAKATRSDSSIASGSPGIRIDDNYPFVYMYLDNWEGGNLVNNLSVDVHDCTDIKTVLL